MSGLPEETINQLLDEMMEELAMVPRLIFFQITGAHPAEFFFLVLRTTPFSELKRYYVSYMDGASVELLRLKFNGAWINDDDTPLSLGMENFCVVEAFFVPSA